MSNEEKLERMREIHTQKLLTKQELSFEEVDFINKNLLEMKSAGIIQEVDYSAIVLMRLYNPANQHLSAN